MSKLTQGQKVTIGVGILAFCGAITAALINHFHGQPPQTVSQSVSNGNGNTQAGRDVNYNYNGVPPTPQNTKQDLRTFFENVNPEILQKIDSGAPQIDVMLGNVSEVKLAEFADRQDFKNYLSYQKANGIEITGSLNHIGDYINELGQNGEMWGFTLYPKDALKR